MTFQIDIISDVVCPWCFIGKRNIEAALEQWRAKHPDEMPVVRWHPFQLNPDLPAGGVPRKQYLESKFGGPERAREIYARVSAAGTRAGIAFAFDAIQTQPNTIDSHRLMHYAGEHDKQDQVAEEIFRRYFLEGADLTDRQVLADIASQAGLNRADADTYLASETDRELIAGAGSARARHRRGRRAVFHFQPAIGIIRRAAAGSHGRSDGEIARGGCCGAAIGGEKNG